MTALCAQTGCERAVVCRGYCGPHYRRRLHTGRYGYRDAARAREHVARLRKLGWTWQGIGDAARLSPWVAHNIHRGRTRRVLAESEAALLSVPLRRMAGHRGVDATGSRRRVQALACIGWPNHLVAARVGCSARSLPTLLGRGRLSASLAARIATVYVELSRTPGPSRGAVAKARLHGFQPPWAWIPETIDDPQAGPIPRLSARPAA